MVTYQHQMQKKLIKVLSFLFGIKFAEIARCFKDYDGGKYLKIINNEENNTMLLLRYKIMQEENPKLDGMQK